MLKRTITIVSAALFAGLLSLYLVAKSDANRAETPSAEDGIVRVSSAYPFGETIERVKGDIAAKGIVFFQAIDQAKLAADVGIKLTPSTLLVFGNPPLGTLFITAKPQAGLDWPVRLLVQQDEHGKVWLTYTDFGWIARRHRITNRGKEFKMASGVIASIVSSAQAK
jgi:uncharacterized protein (DUF302 family)